MSKPAGAIGIDLVGIGSILNSHPLQVPVYQRSYKWEMDQYSEFWSDISEALESDESEYFLGTIVITGGGGKNKALEVIDGQQRLATTAMLFAAIRNVLLEHGELDDVGQFESQYLLKKDLKTKQTVPFMTLNQEDGEFFRSRVIIRDANSLKPSKASHDRILEAFRYLSEKVTELATKSAGSWRDTVLDLAAFVETNVVVIRVDVPDESDAFMIFEALNDRGLSLTISELLKNYLFGIADHRLEAVKQHWAEMVLRIDAAGGEETVITFLRHYWLSWNGITREKDLYKQMRSSIKTPDQAAEFAASLDSASHIYAALLNSDHEYWRSMTGDVVADVDALLGLGLEQNRPLMLAALDTFSEDEKLIFLRALLSWSIRGLVVGGIGKGATEKAYVGASLAIRSKEILTTDGLLDHLGEVVPSDAVFQQRFETVRPSRPAFARYLLLAMENHLRGEVEPELVPNAKADIVNLEHVLPRNPKAEEWPIPVDELREWSGRLGNLVLLPKTKNIKLTNKSFEEKRSVLAVSELLLTKQVGEVDSWDRSAIEARQKEMATYAPVVWPRSPY